MKRLTSSCAFLLAMAAGIIACGYCLSLLAATASIIACCREELFNPAPLSTTASVPVTNTQLRVSFRQPEGWVLIDSGTEKQLVVPYAPVQHATYGLKGRPSAPTFIITYSDSGALSPQEVIASNEASGWRHRGADVTDELYETIAGIPAGGIRYIIGGRVAFYLRVSQPDLTYTFEWTSYVNHSHELEQIYRAMLPTIIFVPPIATPIPTQTATPPSADTYLHPLRPTPRLSRRTPQPDLILGAMLSPELKDVVRGALSLLKACAPETWSFILQYAYAINAPPTPQMNYHMIRYTGVVLLSQTDLFRWPSQSLREFAAMAAIVHQSRHLWQSETHLLADPDALERDAYTFELQVFENPACVSAVPMEDRASLAIMRRTVEESIKNPPTVPP